MLIKSLRLFVIAILFSSAAHSRVLAQQFLDIVTLSTGTSGSFAGSLGGIPVAGAITVPNAAFIFTPTGTGFRDSTINNTSPQYSYSNIYTPSTPLTDRIGYDFNTAAAGTFARIVVSFGAPISNLVLNVAVLDGMVIDFTPTAGLAGLSILSSNGGGGDGLGLSGLSILDQNSATVFSPSPSSPPATSGARSAYGSVALNGTFSTITFDVRSTGTSDGGSFTFGTFVPAAAAVPENGSTLSLLLGVCVAVVTFRRALKMVLRNVA